MYFKKLLLIVFIVLDVLSVCIVFVVLVFFLGLIGFFAYGNSNTDCVSVPSSSLAVEPGEWNHVAITFAAPSSRPTTGSRARCCSSWSTIGVMAGLMPSFLVVRMRISTLKHAFLFSVEANIIWLANRCNSCMVLR